MFNLHLGLSAASASSRRACWCGRSEFPALDEGPPCIVAGDFNDWRSRLRPIFTEVFCFACASEGARGSSLPMKTYPSFSPRGALDRFYFRDLELVRAHRCRLALSKVASDHLPIVADFRLARR